MLTFLEAIKKNPSETAQEVALSHITTLQSEIASIEASLPSMRQQEKLYNAKMIRTATQDFNKVLGNLKSPNTESIIENYVVLKACEQGEGNPYTKKIAETTERLQYLKEVLSLFPNNIDDIKLEE